jgi:hypothetical protein
MKIVHRVTATVDDERQRQLAALGVRADQGLTFFDWDESDPNWPAFQRLIAEWRSADIVTTKWSQAERTNAAWLSMGPRWHHGYPMPDNDGGYLGLTYDLTHYCPACGIGHVQTAPFRMRKEPKWGKRSVLQLNWVFDEYFVKPEVWRETFRAFGISCRPVLQFRTERPLETVVQLSLDVIADSPVRLEGHPYRTCPRCERGKYLPWTRGCFPSFRWSPDPTSTPIVKTQEYFGDGASASRKVIVSQSAYSVMDTGGIRGTSFEPVCEPWS